MGEFVARCKTIARANEEKKRSVPYLSEQIVFSILVWLPADILYNSMRYVCRQWYNIIHDPLFIKEHLLRSTSGLFIQYNGTAQFAAMGKMNATVASFPFPNKVLATCDGLVLFDVQDKLLTVANPVTKQKYTFPPNNWQSSHFSLAFDHSTEKYKVVCTYYSFCVEAYDCAIHTLSKDHGWKLINSNKVSDPRRRIYRSSAPLSLGGFVYWACVGYPFVVALDLESEMIYEFPSMSAVQNTSKVVFYVKKGKSLSCIVQLSPTTLWDVWVLSDPMSGEWTKLYKIDFDVKKRGFSSMFEGSLSRPVEIQYFRPIAWVNNCEVVVFRVSSLGPYVAHNVKTGETFSFGSCDRTDWCYFWDDYAYSLVSLPPS